MATDLHTATVDALSRLDDDHERVWTHNEMDRHVKDGYDAFCRKTKCLFDLHVVENLAPIGNWSSQQEEYLAQLVGLPVMGQINFTAEFERDLAPPGAVGPVKATAPSDRPWLDDLGCDTTGGVETLPAATVEVRRVFHNYKPIFPEPGMIMRQIDRDFQTTQGTPDWFTLDADGLYRIRRVPTPGGDATYDDIDGSWGTVRSEDAYSDTIVGSWGILREDTSAFPSGGPWGIPRRLHPDALNTVVEITRLGKDLDNNLFEIPDTYVRYVVYYAMSKALRRDGPGQDVKLSDHFMERFELGVARMKRRLRNINSEFAGRFGQAGPTPSFGMGNPRTPSLTNWGMESPY